MVQQTRFLFLQTVTAFVFRMFIFKELLSPRDFILDKVRLTLSIESSRVSERKIYLYYPRSSEISLSY